jgi:hypothetical protein
MTPHVEFFEDDAEPLVGQWHWSDGSLILMRRTSTREAMVRATPGLRWVKPMRGWQRNPFVVDFIWACTGTHFEEVLEEWPDILRLGAREWRDRRRIAGVRGRSPAACHHSVAATSGQPPADPGRMLGGKNQSFAGRSTAQVPSTGARRLPRRRARQLWLPGVSPGPVGPMAPSCGTATAGEIPSGRS